MIIRNISGYVSSTIFLLFFLQSSFVACAPENLHTISAIEIQAETIQRDRTIFTIRNLSPEDAEWKWEVSDAETGRVVAESDEREPVFKLRTGCYDVLVTATAGNVLTRHFRRYITVLPKTFSEKQADEVIDLSTVKEPMLVKDYGNRKRPGYKIIIKGRYDGRFKITGLRGTKKHPVHIINQGQVEINSTNDRVPFAFQLSENNQYVLLDGKADPNIPYGFRVKGHATRSGQIFFIGGKFNRGMEMCGFHLIGSQGKTYGAAAIQLQTSYSEDCNASNWNFEYFRVHHVKIEQASSEGMYIGYFTDEERDTGYIPFRLGQVRVYRDTILNSGWDAIQIASADNFEVHDNFVDGAALSGKRSHSSFLSWNNGNTEGYCYRNTFKNCAHAATVIFGESGKKAYIYSNLFVEGSYPSNINTPGFFYSKVYNENQDVGLYIFHNTIVTSRISAKVDYRNTKGNGIPVLYAANAILQNRLNMKKYPEIAMGSNLQDSTSWTIDNFWRTNETQSELQWNDDFRPLKGSPLLTTGFDIQKHIPKLKGGFYDRDGYPLKHEESGYTYGCFSAHQISLKAEPQKTAHGTDKSK